MPEGKPESEPEPRSGREKGGRGFGTPPYVGSATLPPVLLTLIRAEGQTWQLRFFDRGGGEKRAQFGYVDALVIYTLRAPASRGRPVKKGETRQSEKGGIAR